MGAGMLQWWENHTLWDTCWVIAAVTAPTSLLCWTSVTAVCQCNDYRSVVASTPHIVMESVALWTPYLQLVKPQLLAFVAVTVDTNMQSVLCHTD